MDSTNCICNFSQGLAWNDWVGLFASLFAFFISLGYFFKPCLRMCIFEKNNKWRVIVTNHNLFRNSVKDIYCEMAVSSTKEFEKAKTLELEKDSTVFLRHSPDEYIFRAKYPKQCLNSRLANYNYFRVRLLSPNFLGIKKAHEKIIKLDTICNKSQKSNASDLDINGCFHSGSSCCDLLKKIRKVKVYYKILRSDPLEVEFTPEVEIVFRDGNHRIHNHFPKIEFFKEDDDSEFEVDFDNEENTVK